VTSRVPCHVDGAVAQCCVFFHDAWCCVVLVSLFERDTY
jgi:hypothetical protein